MVDKRKYQHVLKSLGKRSSRIVSIAMGVSLFIACSSEQDIQAFEEDNGIDYTIWTNGYLLIRCDLDKAIKVEENVDPLVSEFVVTATSNYRTKQRDFIGNPYRVTAEVEFNLVIKESFGKEVELLQDTICRYLSVAERFEQLKWRYSGDDAEDRVYLQYSDSPLSTMPNRLELISPNFILEISVVEADPTLDLDNPIADLIGNNMYFTSDSDTLLRGNADFPLIYDSVNQNQNICGQ